MFISRLDSYKRLDWLLQALFSLHSPWHISIIGDGPKRIYFETLARDLSHNNPNTVDNCISFLGRQSESQKLQLLSDSHLLVLPSDRCNEDFGIVQLELWPLVVYPLLLIAPGQEWDGSVIFLDYLGQRTAMVWGLYCSSLPMTPYCSTNLVCSLVIDI